MGSDGQDLALRYRNLVGWTWLTHGALLVLGAPGLLGLAWLVGLIGPDLLYQLPPAERIRVEHLQALVAALVPAWPWMLGLGLLVLPPAAAFLRRRPWSRGAVEALTWLHLLVVFPGATWWLLTLPPMLMQFDDHGQPIALMTWISHGSHLVMGLMMEGLAIWLLIVIRKPVLREAFQHPPT